MSKEAEVTKYGFLDMQVCVPSDWTDEQVSEFAESSYPCGTEAGWSIRKKVEGNPDYPERVPCQERDGFVHIMLDA